MAQNSELTVRASEATTRADQLEKRLEKILSRVKKNEAVSKAQLVLFLDALSRGEVAEEATGDEDPRAGANERLRDASGIDEPDDDEPSIKSPRNQPGRRNPAPAHLPGTRRDIKNMYELVRAIKIKAANTAHHRRGAASTLFVPAGHRSDVGPAARRMCFLDMDELVRLECARFSPPQAWPRRRSDAAETASCELTTSGGQP